MVTLIFSTTVYFFFLLAFVFFNNIIVLSYIPHISYTLIGSTYRLRYVIHLYFLLFFRLSTNTYYKFITNTIINNEFSMKGKNYEVELQ